MKIIKSLAGMQTLALKWKREGVRIAFVPTMGYLHDGHMSLVRRARELAGKHGIVVLSIYVNPTQFGPEEDLDRYPRNLPRDYRLCRAEGVDAVFVPRDSDMYPRHGHDAYSTYVVEEDLTRYMEGVKRPGHFRGVTTIVSKLFNLVLPDYAVFGSKDYQQAAVIKRMTRDLNFPVTIDVAPTRRELDGLAMSSRNSYLSPEERSQALALWLAIQDAQQLLVHRSKPIAAEELREHLRKQIEKSPAAKVDYLEFFNPDTLKPESIVHHGTHMAMAVFVGETRLIDNARL